MKVCITSYGPTLDSKVQPVFGRCEYFIFVDLENMKSEIKPNPYASALDKSGVDSARLIIRNGATTVLTARVGTKARQVLDAAGVKIIDIKGETVRQVVEAVRKVSQPKV